MREQTATHAKVAEEKKVVDKCKKGHTLTKLDEYWECNSEECKTLKEYYPNNHVNNYISHDLAREKCILNNDTTSFAWQDYENPDNTITRNAALEKICKFYHNREIEKKRVIDEWTAPKGIHKLLCDEGHNVMIMNKLFKNVAIRWDKDFVQ